jgi:hypothetical protein
MRAVFALVLISTFYNLQAQKKISRSEYIEMYKDISMEEMRRSGIPASITLAQGIIESGNGNGRLATKANNHFGIKCHDWNGPSIKHDDDAKNECFRKYRSAEQSYKDHSDFLTSKQRYAGLFELKPDDYKSWAKGLKRTGYATSPTYARALIQVIEENELYKYDQTVLADVGSSHRVPLVPDNKKVGSNRDVKYNNRVKYIVAKSSDTFESLSEELYMMSWQLPRYNEMPRDTKLTAGEIIYLQPKRNHAARAFKSHMVQEGETLHDIAQKYGVKEEKLRDRNNIPEDSDPKPGVVVLLRGKVKSGIPMKDVIKLQRNNGNNTNGPSEDNQDTEPVEFEIEYDLGS